MLDPACALDDGPSNASGISNFHQPSSPSSPSATSFRHEGAWLLCLCRPVTPHLISTSLVRLETFDLKAAPARAVSAFGAARGFARSLRQALNQVQSAVHDGVLLPRKIAA